MLNHPFSSVALLTFANIHKKTGLASMFATPVFCTSRFVRLDVSTFLYRVRVCFASCCLVPALWPLVTRFFPFVFPRLAFPAGNCAA